MKWTKDLDSKLSNLINEGKKHSEIANILSTTKKSVSNRCDRLGLKIVNKKKFLCKNCNNIFVAYIKEKRNFCCKSCSNSYSNKNRKLSEETKRKISEKLSNKSLKKNDERFLKKNDEGSLKIKLRKCRFCNELKVEKKHKIICDSCKLQYYKFYRPLCEFKFNVNEYKDKFNTDLIKDFGWYSPSNKKNNLNGVSRDHMYSVRDGFINKIDPEIIKHPANCMLLIHTENNKKKFNSVISLDELLDRIKNW